MSSKTFTVFLIERAYLLQFWLSFQETVSGAYMSKMDYRKDSSSSRMEESLWCTLPEHLTERALAYLPLKSLLRMRSVCKKWSSDILNLPAFTKLYTKVSPQQKPWFIISTSKRRFSAYDFDACKWNLLSVPCLPDPDLEVLASSQGLLCYGFRWLLSSCSLISEGWICTSNRRVYIWPSLVQLHSGPLKLRSIYIDVCSSWSFLAICEFVLFVVFLK